MIPRGVGVYLRPLTVTASGAPVGHGMVPVSPVQATPEEGPAPVVAGARRRVVPHLVAPGPALPPAASSGPGGASGAAAVRRRVVPQLLVPAVLPPPVPVPAPVRRAPPPDPCLTPGRVQISGASAASWSERVGQALGGGTPELSLAPCSANGHHGRSPVRRPHCFCGDDHVRVARAPPADRRGRLPGAVSRAPTGTPLPGLPGDRLPECGCLGAPRPVFSRLP